MAARLPRHVDRPLDVGQIDQPLGRLEREPRRSIGGARSGRFVENLDRAFQSRPSAAPAGRLTGVDASHESISRRQRHASVAVKGVLLDQPLLEADRLAEEVVRGALAIASIVEVGLIAEHPRQLAAQRPGVGMRFDDRRQKAPSRLKRHEGFFVLAARVEQPPSSA